MIVNPWQPAVDAQLKALGTLGTLIENRFMPEMQRQWKIDYNLLKAARPYAWSAEPIAACLAAGAAVPDDAAFNMWNIPQ